MRTRFAALALAGTLCLASHSFATWKPEYANAPWELRNWYLTRTLTPQTQKRLGVPWNSCCAHSDVVRTKFSVDRTAGDDEWYWFDSGINDWRQVPPDTIHPNEHAPDGRPTLFVHEGKEVCFYPGDGGI